MKVPSNGGVAEGRGGFFPMKVPSRGGVAEGRGGFFPMEVPSRGGVAEGRGGLVPSKGVIREAGGEFFFVILAFQAISIRMAQG
jgi:hypothetical protein